MRTHLEERAGNDAGMLKRRRDVSLVFVSAIIIKPSFRHSSLHRPVFSMPWSSFLSFKRRRTSKVSSQWFSRPTPALPDSLVNIARARHGPDETACCSAVRDSSVYVNSGTWACSVKLSPSKFPRLLSKAASISLF